MRRVVKVGVGPWKVGVGPTSHVVGPTASMGPTLVLTKPTVSPAWFRGREEPMLAPKPLDAIIISSIMLNFF
jgi:hypothetical protein